VCTNGVCKGTLPLACDDANPCTSDWCDAALGCQHAPLVAACNDGNKCTGDDQCLAGQCVGGPAVSCDDSNVCTDDSCEPAKGCLHALNAASCDDGNACTSGDVCLAGTCKAGGAVTCNDSNLCTDDSCDPAKGCLYTPNTVPCNDSNACTSGDKCGGGSCIPGAGITCNDGKPCTTDSCEPATGCVYTPITPCCGNGVKEGTEECDDGNNVSNDGCSADCKSEFSGCQGGAQLLSTSPNSQIVVCYNASTCEQDYESLCPTGWELCSQLQYTQRNDGWNYSTGGKTGLGAIRCRNGGGAGHYTIHTGNLGQDEGDNCHYGSSRPSCPSSYGCNEQGNLAVCCKHNALCGNGKVDGAEEECDDGNKSNDDSCLNNCMSRYTGGCG
jgi:cysteine-rich repeat protein